MLTLRFRKFAGNDNEVVILPALVLTSTTRNNIHETSFVFGFWKTRLEITVEKPLTLKAAQA